jgi:hypothetical protein
MVSTRNPRIWSMARKHTWGEVYEPLVHDEWSFNPHFVENSHEGPFSIISKANTYWFWPRIGLQKKIQECDLWPGNICGVTCTSLWSMINGQTTPFLSITIVNHYFQLYWRLTPMDFWPRIDLHQKSNNVTYGKETYLGWGLRASSWWSIATQPLFWQKLPWTTIFNNNEG